MTHAVFTKYFCPICKSKEVFINKKSGVCENKQCEEFGHHHEIISFVGLGRARSEKRKPPLQHHYKQFKETRGMGSKTTSSNNKRNTRPIIKYPERRSKVGRS